MSTPTETNGARGPEFCPECGGDSETCRHLAWNVPVRLTPQKAIYIRTRVEGGEWSELTEISSGELFGYSTDDEWEAFYPALGKAEYTFDVELTGSRRHRSRFMRKMFGVQGDWRIWLGRKLARWFS